MNILVIAGHGDGDSGAVGNGYKEADLTRTQARKLVEKLKQFYTVTLYPTSKNCYKESKGGLVPNYKAFDFVIELHFNSYSKDTAKGTEVYVKEGYKFNHFLAEELCTNISALLNTTNRGVKKRTDLHNMNKCYAQNVPYLLLETCFISNKTDIETYNVNIDKVVQEIVLAFKSNIQPNVSRETLYRVQVGAFTNKENATKLQQELIDKGYPCIVVS